MNSRVKIIEFPFIAMICLSVLSFSNCKSFVMNKDDVTPIIQEQLVSMLGNNVTHDLNYDIDSLPLSIIHHMESELNQRIRIANPKDRMRISDKIDESNYDLPTRRLLFWKKIDNDYLIVLERGGRTHNLLLLHFKYKAKPKLVTSLGIHTEPKHSYKYVLNALKKNKVLLLYNRNIKMKRRYAYY